MTVVVLPTPPFWLATAIVRGVVVTMLNPSCEKVATSVVKACWILFGKPRAAYPGCEEDCGREEDQARFDRRGRHQPALIKSDSDQAV
jgi:hypothetical protein